jgi:REP element-mobilizing transposase RayT
LFAYEKETPPRWNLTSGQVGLGMSDADEPNPFPQRLHHATPTWVKSGCRFHIRLRIAPDHRHRLTDPAIGYPLLEAARRYHHSLRWHCRLILLMPDHAHALLGFPTAAHMSRVVGDWKRFTTRSQGIAWQTDFFDHRIRDHHELQETGTYIRRNPVAKRLCACEIDWPWVWPDGARE